jgi:hypothetical protein
VKTRGKGCENLYILVNTVFFYSFSCNLFPNTWLSTGVQFEESDGGTVALVHCTWLNSSKEEVFWPPYKTQEQYNKALKKGDLPSESWTTYKISGYF